jgi:hypothetical protein
MRKSQKNSSTSAPSYTDYLDEDINTNDYPYYSRIPIKDIREKQERMIRVYRPVLSPVLTQEQFPPLTNAVQIYNGPPIQSPIPVFNLVPVQGEENTYRVDIKSLEEKANDLQRMIDENNQKLTEQDNAIITNNVTLEKQAETITSQNVAIQHNATNIQQQLTAYNHNAAILQQQNNTYYYNNTYIANQNATLEDLKKQVDDYQQQLQQLQEQLESVQNELAYHGNMLGAFNTMIQNPEYFTQLMAATLNSMAPPPV